MILLGNAIRWTILQLARTAINRYVFHGDPYVAQAARRARRWGMEVQFTIKELP